MTSEPKLLGTKESAKYLGVGYARFKKIVASGALSPVPGTTAYLKADLDRLLAGRRDDANPA